jgi:multisubunit Na+/H+ antiporter MnhE subunit
LNGPSLTPEQKQAIGDAKAREASFAGAAKVAAFNGWTFGFFAAISILFGLFSIPGFLVGVGLAAVTRNEFVGRKRLLAYDPEGLELLWRNQIGLMALIVAYCAWSLYRAVAFPDPGLADMTEIIGQEGVALMQELTAGAYVAVIVLTVLFQGLNARYYFVRIARLREYLRDTPSWVLDLQRSLG